MKTTGRNSTERQAGVSPEEIEALRGELAALGLTIPHGLEVQWADAWVRIRGLARRVRDRAGQENREPAHRFSVDRTPRSVTPPIDPLTIAEAGRRIADGSLSPVDLTDSVITRIEDLDPELHAYATPMIESARTAARQAAEDVAGGRYRGPLHGIPLAIKDIYDTAGVRTACGSRRHLDRVPDRDATTVRRLKDAGAIIMGKATTHEFAMGGPEFRGAVSAGPQSLGPVAVFRGIQQRFRGRRAGRPGAGGHGQRHHGLDPHSGHLLRHGGPQAYLRACEPGRRCALGLVAGHLRAHGLDGRGLRPDAGGPGRPRSCRLHDGRVVGVPRILDS